MVVVIFEDRELHVSINMFKFASIKSWLSGVKIKFAS